MKRIKGIKKRFFRLTTLCLAATMICSLSFLNAHAENDRGSVSISLSKQTVSLSAGETVSVGISLSPASDVQLPGCDMEGCPNCENGDCLNEKGECTCGGAEYQTYYTSVALSSDNGSVASASYGNSAVSIRGLSAGSATVTLTASLRQYESASVTIQVNVSEKASDSADGSSGSSDKTPKTSVSEPADPSSPSPESAGEGSETGDDTEKNTKEDISDTDGDEKKGEISDPVEGSIEAASGSKTSKQEKNTTSNPQGKISSDSDENITLEHTERGIVYYVQITGEKQGSAQFEEIKGFSDMFVDFQKKDESGEMLYFWEFCGEDLLSTDGMVFTVDGSSQPFEGYSETSQSQALYLTFKHHGELPGKAFLYYRVNDYFDGERSLYAYSYDSIAGSLTLIEEGLSIENGYIVLTLSEASDCILTTERIDEEIATDEITGEVSAAEESNDIDEDKGGLPAWAIVLIVIIAVIVIICIALILRKRSKKDKTDTTGMTDTTDTRDK